MEQQPQQQQQQQQQQPNKTALGRLFRKMSLDAGTVFQNKHEKHDSEDALLPAAIPNSSDAALKSQQSQPQQEPKQVIDKIHELEETITRMRIHNERLSLDLTRLQQQLISAASHKTHSEHLRVTIVALQTQIGILLDELHLAWEGRYDRMSLQSILEFSLTRRPNTANDEKWRNFQKQFMQKLQQIIHEAEVRMNEGQQQQRVGHVKSHSRSVSTQTQKDQPQSALPSSHQQILVRPASPKYVPKRIANRPPRIRIPMVRIQNARLQEIELLRGAAPAEHQRPAGAQLTL